MRLALFAILLAVAGCSVIQPVPEVVHTPTSDWRAVATDADRERLRDWRDAFTSALAAARASGHADAIAREGALLDPDAALAGEPIPNGLYRCRVIKLGAKSTGLLDYVAYPRFICRVQQQGRLREFVKLTGSQRPVGLIFPDDRIRQVFLGTVMLADEARAMQYGVDETRDVVGFFEQIGPNRWRLVMPSPHFESQLDVMELVPAS
ncbi:MAG TPA: DUF4893 domain-containing protein [Sphingomicrobium sp.]|jgi:hypothetical protein|nr:DUF4893 domain-containing protein [Sphingomicrobium sp.]